MRLPGQRERGVESLGRYDVSGPGRVWQARTRASQALATTVSDVSGAVVDILNAQDEAKNLQLLNQRIMDDQIENARELEYLKNTPVIRMDDENVPQEIKDYAFNWSMMRLDPGQPPPSYVETHEIVDQYMLERLKKRTSDSLQALKGTNLEAKYLAAMDDSVSGAVSDVMRSKVQGRQQSMRAEFMVQFNQAKNGMDAVRAQQLLHEAYTSGVILPKELVELENTIVTDVNYAKAMDRIDKATTMDQVEFAKASALQPGVLELDKRKEIRTAARQQERYILELRDREQENNEAELVADGIEQKPGTLKKAGEWVRQQKVKSSVGRGVANAVSRPAPLSSNPIVYDNIRGQISLIGRVGEEPDIQAEIHRIRQFAINQNRGFDEQGNQIEKTITGEDLAEINGLLDAEQKLLEDIEPAMVELRAISGFTEMLSGLNGNTPQNRAFIAGRSWLRAWRQANPRASVSEMSQALHAEQERFHPASYEEDWSQDIINAFPQYGDILVKGDGTYDKEGVAAQATLDFRNGVMDEADYIWLLRELGVKRSAASSEGKANVMDRARRRERAE